MCCVPTEVLWVWMSPDLSDLHQLDHCGLTLQVQGVSDLVLCMMTELPEPDWDHLMVAKLVMTFKNITMF